MLFEKLKSFVTIVNKGSYKAAAEDIHLSQPAITHHIKSLESYFNVTLFRLSPKKPVLTAEGNRLYQMAKPVLLSMTDLESAMEEFQYAKERITFSATSTVSTYLLPKILGEFKQANPGVFLDFKVGNTEFVKKLLIEGRLNFGILGTSGNLPKRFKKMLFHQEPLKFVCSPNNDLVQKKMVTLADIKKNTLLIREEGTKTRVIFEKWLRKHDFKMGLNNEFGQMETVKHAVEQDLGISVLPLIAVHDEVKNGRLHVMDVKGFKLIINYYLVVQPKKYLPEAAINLLNCLNPDLAF
jgi:LysR family transcriptional regulator, transcriptional activator of the cysJI operon